MEIVVKSKKSLFQQKFQKKSYALNGTSQFKSVMSKWSNWTSGVGVGQKIRLPVLLGIRLHPKTSDSLRLRNPGWQVNPFPDGVSPTSR